MQLVREVAMNRARLAVVVFIILVGTTGASFQRIDEPLWMCEGRASESGIPEINILRCATYMGGISDLNAVIQSPGAALFCPPERGISLDQVRLIFVKWAQEHPEDLLTTARVSAIPALAETFPCQR